MKFTDAHTAATVCSPSRYGLMTGRSPWRLHKKGNGYSLEAGRMTMASLLKTNGYQSAAIGKWHLGYSKDWNQLPITGPLEVGFDYHFGVPQNHNDSTRCFIENHDTLCLTDMLATSADILGVRLPDNAGEDSISLLSVLLGKQPTAPLRKAIFVQGDTDDNAIAVCTGRWKMIETTKPKKDKVHQLYDLYADPGETTDIAKAHLEVVKQLAADLAKARADGRTRS